MLLTVSADEVAAPVAEPAPVVAPVVENKRFTLRSDVLFNFNKSTLKAEGQEALNQLFNELASIDPTQGNVRLSVTLTASVPRTTTCHCLRNVHRAL